MIAANWPRRTAWQGQAAADTGAGRLVAAVTVLAMLLWMAAPEPALRPMTASPDARDGERVASLGAGVGSETDVARDWRLGGYVGASYTYPSRVLIDNPPGTRLQVEGFEWIGMPFKSPIYYGARVDRVPVGAGIGALYDFTHAKAIAKDDSVANFTGTRDGKPIDSKGRIRDTFKHLEFSHGHNILTLNGVWRAPLFARLIRPYAGLGGGITLPHTEIGFRDAKDRTYEYQWAGFAAQVLAGIEVPLGRTSVFFEWKLTYAPMSVPLSHEPYGWLLVTDLWRQLRAIAAGEKPPGGTLRTTLVTHHGYGGVMVRIGR